MESSFCRPSVVWLSVSFTLTKAIGIRMIVKSTSAKLRIKMLLAQEEL